MQEQLTSGNWIAEGESAGPRISLIVEAIVAAKAKVGVVLTIETVTEKYKALDKAGQKDIREEKLVAREYEAIKLRKAQERLDKAEAAVADGETTDFEF